MLLVGAAPALANEGDGEKTYTIPITLTIVHMNEHIDVTLPAAMPISVLDGRVLVADNLRIENHSETLAVSVTGVTVQSGSYEVMSYEEFPSSGKDLIALQINGIGTTGAGPMEINHTAFPSIAQKGSMPIRYNAKVLATSEVSGESVANVVFILKAG